VSATTLPRIDGPADAELISAVRGGDVDAYGELFRRHVDAARRLARGLVSGPDVDDLVSEAFAKVLTVLQRGGGPDLAFRAYLLTAVRRLHVDRIRASSRLRPTDDLTPFDPGVPFRDTAVEGFENAAAARAFASLPERWQLVLWHTEVEGQKPAEIAPLLGISANSVSALAYRAREGLRQAFLSMHAQEATDEACALTQDRLGSYVRGGLARRDATRVERHLEECRRCAAVWLELTDINSDIAGLLAPLLLGGLAAAYVGSAGGAAAAGGGVVALLGRVRDLLTSNAPATATAGLTAGALLVGGLLYAVNRSDSRPEAEEAATSSPSPGTPHVAHHHAAPPRAHGRRGPAPVAPTPVTTPPSTPLLSTPPPAAPGPAPSGPQPSGPEPSPGGSGGPGSGGHDGSDDPPPPQGMDLAVAATVTRSSPVAFEVEVTVTGLAPDRTATLGITADHTAASISPDPRCAGLGIGRAECTVTRTPTTYTFLVAAPPDAPTTMTFVVHPESGVRESDPSDNTTRVVLTP
jgi:RNA polymerase sigma factor (sigma-70 family)